MTMDVTVNDRRAQDCEQPLPTNYNVRKVFESTMEEPPHKQPQETGCKSPRTPGPKLFGLDKQRAQLLHLFKRRVGAFVDVDVDVDVDDADTIDIADAEHAGNATTRTTTAACAATAASTHAVTTSSTTPTCASSADSNTDTKTSTSTTELSIIIGSSGSGKTVLAQTLQHHAEFFLMGKCDQIQQGSEPFGPFVAAFTQLVEAAFEHDAEKSTSGADRRMEWMQSNVRKSIHETAEIHLLTDMVPALADFFPLMGNDSYHHASSATTNKTMQRSTVVENPTVKVACKFLRCLCSTEHPIVLLIDDIQWIDSSSLELVQYLASDREMPGFMLLATCRDNEVAVYSPLSQALQNLQGNKGVSINYIEVGNLPIESVREVAADVFPTLTGQGLHDLANVVYTHTKGNAFFTTQIINRLKKSGWEAPEHSDSDEDWNFDDDRSMIDRLTALDCDALVNFVVADTAKESPLTKQVMKTASCLGTEFMTSHLIAVVNRSGDRVAEALSLMEKREFIRPLHGRRGWGWSHDKFQKGAYLLISKADRESFHLEVGRQLLSALSKEELQQILFIVASQFSIAIKAIDGDETERIAALMLQAGEKSALSSSFGAAASYFSMGTSLLKDDNWESQYKLSLKLYNAAAETECCKGHFAEADKLVTVILRHAHSFEDRLRAYETKLYYLSAKEENNKAICLALDIFEQLGEKFPKNPGTAMITYELMTTRWLLSKHSEGEILNMETMKDCRKLAVLRITQLVFPSLLRANPYLTPVIVCRSIKCILKHGLSDASCYLFGTMCMLLIHPLGYLEEGFKCGRICEDLLEEYGVEDFLKCRVHLTLYGYCLPLQAPLRASLDSLQRTGELGLTTGDLDHGCMSFTMRAFTLFFCGRRLEEVVSVTREYLKNFQACGQHPRISLLITLEQLLENLIHPKQDVCSCTGSAMHEESWVDKAMLTNDEYRIITYWLFKAFVAVYMGEHKRARCFMTSLMKYSLSTASGGTLYQIYFLDALVDVILARDNGKRARKYKLSLKKLELYGQRAPENVKNKICLIEAELAVIKGKNSSNDNDARSLAMSKFEESIAQANTHGVTNEEALAYERFGIAMIEWGDVTQALEYFERAISLYGQWGSPVKVTQLTKFIQEKYGLTMCCVGKRSRNG